MKAFLKVLAYFAGYLILAICSAVGMFKLVKKVLS